MIQIPFYKYWNTWSTKSPAEMYFLPAGFSVRTGAYSFAAGKYTSFPFSKSIKLYEHHPDGNYCRLDAGHAGTVLGIEYLKNNPWTVTGRIKVKKHGEWGLRFWVLLSFGFESGGKLEIPENGKVYGERRSYNIAVSAGSVPSRSALFDDPDTAGLDMEQSGYFVPERPYTDGGWAVFKYNLEQTPEIYFAVSAANSMEEARRRADKALSSYACFDKRKENVMSKLPKQTGPLSGSIEAVRDVMAWNSVADMKNGRVFTSLTRQWIDKKFGGWFIWQDDVFYHVLLNAFSGDFTMARENLNAVLSLITPDGNLACLMSEYTEWVDRSQPPIDAFIIWKYFRLSGDTQMLTAAYPLLKTTYEWWFKNRDGNANGVLEYGSSCNGHGHFTGTKLAAKDESAMDNSPVHDSAAFIVETHTLNMEDIALNSLLALNGEILSGIAQTLGYQEESRRIAAHNDDFKRRIDNTLWDEKREIYANRHWEKGFGVCAPTSFYPLAAGIPDDSRADKLIGHIFNKDEFWTKAPLPSVSAAESSVNDNVYWRGRTWAPLNFFTYVGLKRYRRDKEAYTLAKRCMETFSARWKEERACYENYNTFTGHGGDSVDSDRFYGWGALMPLLWVMEHIDIDPWNGFCFGDTARGTFSISGLKIQGAFYSLDCRAGITSLEKDKTLIFKSNARGRFRRFTFDGHYASAEIDSQPEACEVSFPSCNPFRCMFNGHEIKTDSTVNISAGNSGKIEMWF